MSMQRSVFAKEALEVTDEAFQTVRERMLKALLDAESEPKAWQALLTLRGLEAARKQLLNFVDTGTIEREAANRRAAD